MNGSTDKGAEIVKIADELYGEVQARKFIIYGSPMRPMSSVWARIPKTRFVNANYSQDKMHTWIVAEDELDEKTVRDFELQGPIFYVFDVTESAS